MKRKSLGKALIAVGIALGIVALNLNSEAHLRDRSVMLVSKLGSCSGEQVRAPSGIDYILTAGHCGVLAVNGSIEVITESGKHLQRRVIAEDPKSDLLLLEGLPSLKGLEIANKSERFQHVRTFTHGKGMKTYKTEGELIQDDHLDVILSLMGEEGSADKCDMPKQKIEEIEVFIFKLKACCLSVDETITTALIVPGSSGGMVVDDGGKLVGVASASAGPFGALVRLKDIRKFLTAY